MTVLVRLDQSACSPPLSNIKIGAMVTQVKVVKVELVLEWKVAYI